MNTITLEIPDDETELLHFIYRFLDYEHKSLYSKLEDSKHSIKIKIEWDEAAWNWIKSQE